ncbi:hypothetical protein Clacol_003100 [Clathrus columnatus]|uniref:Survival Motor Neuron Gemin2-binding domain-containing protein n=1 Tax=Clathrus columnatus TaxID=1419009 RepID=A0AAV5A3N9_9AGAM|nr:hypothetical protein Clacol_003100 [Clathrus columnatus]
MRSLISYDDLTDVQTQGDNHTKSASPPKKRRKPNRNSNRKSGGGSSEVQRNAAPKPSKPRNGIQQQERYLTHEEIWDDSALINAWNAAAEEYEVLNGPDKQWKTEPVNKSALSVVTHSQKDVDESKVVVSTGMPSIPAEFAVHFESSAEMEEDVQEAEEDQENSRPIDFDTFVPQHDPSLDLPLGQGTIDEKAFAQVVPSPPKTLSSVSADQALQNAMGAWYWAGYWTGIYHATSKTKSKVKVHQNDNDDDNEEELEDERDEITGHSPEVITDETDLIPT